jgi:hypothetical protein
MENETGGAAILTHPDVATVDGTARDDGSLGSPHGPALPPLAVSALMVTKADLIRALRVYVPHLADLEAIDGDRFLLSLGSDHPATEPPDGGR